jgi:hypothetical protein
MVMSMPMTKLLTNVMLGNQACREKVTGQVRRSDGWYYLEAGTVTQRAARSTAREPDARTDRQGEPQAT